MWLFSRAIITTLKNLNRIKNRKKKRLKGGKKKKKKISSRLDG